MNLILSARLRQTRLRQTRLRQNLGAPFDGGDDALGRLTAYPAPAVPDTYKAP